MSGLAIGASLNYQGAVLDKPASARAFSTAFSLWFRGSISAISGTYGYIWHRASYSGGLGTLGLWIGVKTGTPVMAVGFLGSIHERSHTASWPASLQDGTIRNLLFTFDGNTGTPGIKCYVANTVHDTTGGAGGFTAGNGDGPIIVGNRLTDGTARPVGGVFGEIADFDRVLDSTDRAALEAGTCPLDLAGGPPIHYIRFVGGRAYDLIDQRWLDHGIYTIDLNTSTLTGTPAAGHVCIQQHTGWTGVWHVDTGTRVPMIRNIGPITPGSTVGKRFRTGAITGKFQFGELVTQGTARGYYAGDATVSGASDRVVMLFGIHGTAFTGTGVLTGFISGATVTPSTVADAYMAPAGTLRAVTAGGGAGTYTFGETCTATGGGVGTFCAETGGVVYVASADGSFGNDTFTGTLTGGSSAATRTITAAAAYVASVSRLTGTAWDYSLATASTVTDRSGTSGTATPGPGVVTDMPASYPRATTNLKGFWEFDDHIAKPGRRILEVLDRSGFRNHLSALSPAAMSSLPESTHYQFASLDEGRLNTTPQYFVPDHTATLSPVNFSVFGVWWKCNTNYAADETSFDMVFGLKVMSSGEAKVRYNSTDYAFTPPLYMPNIPTFFAISYDGTTLTLRIGSDVGTRALSLSTAVALGRVGTGGSGSLNVEDYNGIFSLAIEQSALTQAEMDALHDWYCTRWPICRRWSAGVGIIEGSSTFEGVCGMVTSNTTTIGFGQRRSIPYWTWRYGYYRNTRMFNLAVSGSGYDQMELRKDARDTLFLAFPGRWFMHTFGTSNEIYGGTTPANTLTEVVAYNGAAYPALARIQMQKIINRTSDAFDANRTTFNAYTAAQLLADVLSEDVVSAEHATQGAGDNVHLSVTGAETQALESGPDTAALLANRGGGGLRGFRRLRTFARGR